MIKTVNPTTRATFVKKLLAFAESDSYMMRHLFLYMCSSLVQDSPPPEFVQSFLPLALALKSDKVANVRAALTRFLSGQLLQIGSLFTFSLSLLGSSHAKKKKNSRSIRIIARGSHDGRPFNPRQGPRNRHGDWNLACDGIPSTSTSINSNNGR